MVQGLGSAVRAGQRAAAVQAGSVLLGLCCRRTRTSGAGAFRGAKGRVEAWRDGSVAPTLPAPARPVLSASNSCCPFVLPLDAVDAPRSAVEAAEQAPSHPQSLRGKGLGRDHARPHALSMYHRGRRSRRGSARHWFIPEPRMGHEAKLLCVIGQRRSRLLVWWSRDAASGPCASRPSDSCLGCLAGCLGWGIAAFRFWDCLGAGDAS